MKNSKTNISILMLSLGSGGAEKVVSLLLTELKNDFNVNLVLFYNVIHFPIPDGVNVIILSKNATDIPKKSKLFAFTFLSKYYLFIKNENIKISISFLPFPNLINGIIALLCKKVKIIISERGFPSSDTTSKLSLFISKVLYPILYNRADALFSNSTHINKDLKDNFGIKIPMEVIYNPIEIPSKIIRPEGLINYNNSFNIITVGSLNKNKNHIMILRALSELKNYNVKLNILGNGELYNYLESEIINYNLITQVKLSGKVKDVNAHLIKGNCFILASFSEGFPNALLEAMAIGLPCISTNCLCGPLELLNDNEEVDINEGKFYLAKYGILINTNDSIALRNALNFLINNPEALKKYSKLSVEQSLKYNVKSIYSEFVGFLNR